jgi:hypothetical protein
MAMAHPAMQSGAIQVREILRDGSVVAVLVATDNGDTFTVVTEVFTRRSDSEELVQRRAYAFTDVEAGLLFLSEAATAFTYLGCEVRDQ